MSDNSFPLLSSCRLSVLNVAKTSNKFLFVGIQKNKVNVIPTIKDLFNNNETDNPFNGFVCFLFNLGKAR